MFENNVFFFFFSATHKTESLSNEVLILKDDFEEAKSALKQKEEEIRVYKEQLEKMGNEDFPKSPMDGDILGKVLGQELPCLHRRIFWGVRGVKPP